MPSSVPFIPILKINARIDYFCKMHGVPGEASYDTWRKLGYWSVSRETTYFCTLNQEIAWLMLATESANHPTWQMSKPLPSILMGWHILFCWGQVPWNKFLWRWKGRFNDGFYVASVGAGYTESSVCVCVCARMLTCTHVHMCYLNLPWFPIFLFPLYPLQFNPLFIWH